MFNHPQPPKKDIFLFPMVGGLMVISFIGSQIGLALVGGIADYMGKTEFLGVMLSASAGLALGGTLLVKRVRRRLFPHPSEPVEDIETGLLPPSQTVAITRPVSSLDAILKRDFKEQIAFSHSRLNSSHRI